jgi:RecB family endonuclease NucS
MLIGRQEDTGLGGRIDLLAIAPDGSPILIELKRDRTPREVVAQAIDYASWVEKLRGHAAHRVKFAEATSEQRKHRPKRKAAALDGDFLAEILTGSNEEGKV